MVQSAQDWCGENYSRSFGQFVLAAQHIRRISARVRKDGPLPRISDNRCGASMSQHQKPEDDYLPSSAQSSHLLAYRMAACSCAGRIFKIRDQRLADEIDLAWCEIEKKLPSKTSLSVAVRVLAYRALTCREADRRKMLR
jgi:hypothetical protein